MEDENNQNQEQQIVTQEEKPAEGNKNLYMYVFIVFAVVLVVAYIAYMRSKGNAATTEGQAGPSPTGAVSESLVVGKNAVAVSDFTPGNKVNVGMVLLENPGYVVIHEDENNELGDIIGKSELLSAGESQNIEIDLERSSVDGEILYAMLHSDDGDGKFEFPGDDKPVVDENGNNVMMIFLVGTEESSNEEITPAVNY